MPLELSANKEAVGRNIAREVEAGKPRRQSIAIALNVQRKAQGKAKPKNILDRLRFRDRGE